MANMERTPEKWSLPIKLDQQTRTATLATANKYVDKDIAIEVTAQDAEGSISGGALTHGEITTTDTTYLTGTSTSNGYAVTISNVASRDAISAPIAKAGWVDNGDIASVAATGDDTKTKTFYVKKGSAKVNSS